jgi:hypothetical protein
MAAIIKKTNPAENGKKKSGVGAYLAARSLREKVMFYSLIVILIAAALIYFLVLPGIRNLDAIREEVILLQEQEANARSVMAQIEPNNNRYREAKIRFDAARTRYYLPMAPETIDEKITGLLVDCGFAPDTLSMSLLTQEEVYPFAPQVLSAEPTADPNAGTGSSGVPGSAFVYTVNVSVFGEYKNFYSLLENINHADGIELVQFDYREVDPVKVIVTNGIANMTAAEALAAGRDHVSMIIKIYVYVEGALTVPTVDPNAPPEEAPAKTEDKGNTSDNKPAEPQATSPSGAA